ncbi:MAG: hypothetical protein Q8P59_02445, partial [Dehalococcoidia bacterium]|nr:hypothetical protein [Dehalococcoidia bacterium]
SNADSHGCCAYPSSADCAVACSTDPRGHSICRNHCHSGQSPYFPGRSQPFACERGYEHDTDGLADNKCNRYHNGGHTDSISDRIYHCGYGYSGWRPLALRTPWAFY